MYTVCTKEEHKYETYHKQFLYGSHLRAACRSDQIAHSKFELRENDILPSVRALSKELKISALTVKKSYDTLESEGFTVTVHGKGTYVKAVNTDLLLEEQKKEVETDFEQAILKGRRYGISDEDLKNLFELIMEG